MQRGYREYDCPLNVLKNVLWTSKVNTLVDVTKNSPYFILRGGGGQINAEKVGENTP